MLAIADLLPGGEPSPECRPSRPTGRFRRQPTADSAGKTRNPESPDRPREDCQPSSLAPTRNRDTLIPGKEPGRCNHARQFQQVPGRTEEHGAMLGDEVEVLTGETNERSPLSELLHDELPGKQGVSIAFSPVDDEVEGMIIAIAGEQSGQQRRIRPKGSGSLRRDGASYPSLGECLPGSGHAGSASRAPVPS